MLELWAGLPEAGLGGDGLGLGLVVTAVPHCRVPIICKLRVALLEQQFVEQGAVLQPDVGEETAVSVAFACLGVELEGNGRFSKINQLILAVQTK